VRLEVGVVEAVPFPDASFDVVASTNRCTRGGPGHTRVKNVAQALRRYRLEAPGAMIRGGNSVIGCT
jgi:hypothetical protein